MSNLRIYKNTAKCQICKHSLYYHGYLRSAGVAEGKWDDLVLVREIPCIEKDCNCKFFAGSNLEFLQGLYEQSNL